MTSGEPDCHLLTNLNGIGSLEVNAFQREGGATAIVTLLEDDALAARLADRGRERVRREFLTPRLVRDDVALYGRLLAGSKTPAAELTAFGAGG